MPTTPNELLKIGAWVRVLPTGFGRAKIVEYRGALGPNGTHIYRVRYRGGRMPGYAEFREDQLELLPEAEQVDTEPDCEED